MVSVTPAIWYSEKLRDNFVRIQQSEERVRNLRGIQTNNTIHSTSCHQQESQAVDPHVAVEKQVLNYDRND